MKDFVLQEKVVRKHTMKKCITLAMLQEYLSFCKFKFFLKLQEITEIWNPHNVAGGQISIKQNSILQILYLFITYLCFN